MKTASIPSSASPILPSSSSGSASASVNVSWLRLNELIENSLADILSRERDNADRIYIYDTGGYWVSFEHSAWQSGRLFPKHNVAVLKLPSHPFPIVMSSVPDSAVHSYLHRHIVRHCGDRAILSAPAVQPDQYRRWHREIVEDLR